MSRCLLLSGEDTGRLNDVLSASILPWDVGRVTLLVHLDSLAVDDEIAGFVGGDFALEVSVGGVVLEHVYLCEAGDVSCVS